MKTIEKKVWPEYFQKIIDGKKNFELRLNDFEIKEGDTLLLKEWNPATKTYTGRELSRTVGYVGGWKIDDLTKFWSREDIESKGIQVIALKEVGNIPRTSESYTNMKKLCKSRENKVWGGVISGIGEYFGVDPVILRVAWVVITIFSGVIPGLVMYFAACFIVPNKPSKLT